MLTFADQLAHHRSEFTRLDHAAVDRWIAALQMTGDLGGTLVAEVARWRGCSWQAALERMRTASDRCLAAWRPDNPIAYYEETDDYIEELMWWHTLQDNQAPLANLVALDAAKERRGRRYLDFGSGVGSTGILFAKYGFDVTLADISSFLLAFSAYRFDTRKLSVRLVHLRYAPLPAATFDVITAMDVIEHLTDPVSTIAYLANALAPGGILVLRFDGPHPEHPQHIVPSFAPCAAELERCGLRLRYKDPIWETMIYGS